MDKKFRYGLCSGFEGWMSVAGEDRSKIEVFDDDERRRSIMTDPLDLRTNTKLMQVDKIACDRRCGGTMEHVPKHEVVSVETLRHSLKKMPSRKSKNEPSRIVFRPGRGDSPELHATRHREPI